MLTALEINILNLEYELGMLKSFITKCGPLLPGVYIAELSLSFFLSLSHSILFHPKR